MPNRDIKKKMGNGATDGHVRCALTIASQHNLVQRVGRGQWIPASDDETTKQAKGRQTAGAKPAR